MDAETLRERLAEPFDQDEIKFRAGATAGNRALALGYIDARVVEDRLDDVLGVAGWQDSYETLDHGVVLCHLRVRIDGEWIEKCDVGGESEQKDEGDKAKAAFSDALKRAAIKWGVGRYLYSLPQQWVDYDPVKKQLKTRPTLPAWALPKKAASTQAAKPAQQPAVNGKAEHALPADGKELLVRLNKYESQLVKQGRCGPGDLVNYILEVGGGAYGADMSRWGPAAMQFAAEQTRAFEKNHPAPQPPPAKK